MVSDPDELAEFFSIRPAVHVYALADLEEPYWSPSRWYRREHAVVGIVELPGMPWNTVYAVTTRHPTYTNRLLAEVAPSLDAGTLITGEIGMYSALSAVRGLDMLGLHHRYELVDAAAVPEPDQRVVPLGIEQLADLERLYAIEPGEAAFIPHSVGDGAFVGVYEGGELVAAAGTHVLSERYGCAAVGSVYTRPAHRGRGLGRAVTAGVIHSIADRVPLIALNVADDNRAARTIYESIGFTSIHEYLEAELH